MDLTSVIQYIDTLKSDPTHTQIPAEIDTAVGSIEALIANAEDSGADEDSILRSIFKSIDEAKQISESIPPIIESMKHEEKEVYRTLAVFYAAAVEYINIHDEEVRTLEEDVKAVNPENPSLFPMFVIESRIVDNGTYSLVDVTDLPEKITKMMEKFSDLSAYQKDALVSVVEAVRVHLIPSDSQASMIKPWFELVLPQIMSLDITAVELVDELTTAFCDSVSASEEIVYGIIDETVKLALEALETFNRPALLSFIHVFREVEPQFSKHSNAGKFIVSLFKSPQLYERLAEDDSVLPDSLTLITTLYDSLPRGFHADAINEFFTSTDDTSLHCEYARGLLAFTVEGLDLLEFKVFTDRIISNVGVDPCIRALIKASIASGLSHRKLELKSLVEFINTLAGDLKAITSTFGTFDFFAIMIANMLAGQKSVVSSLKKAMFAILKQLHTIEMQDAQAAMIEIINYLEERIDLPQEILDLVPDYSSEEFSDED
ncbi:hypothetical protein P9112_007891 [Eukaryota sp. TZLM1-RC]